MAKCDSKGFVIRQDQMGKLMILAKIGQLMADEVVPGAKLFLPSQYLLGLRCLVENWQTNLG